jgi:hypothetical protein
MCHIDFHLGLPEILLAYLVVHQGHLRSKIVKARIITGATLRQGMYHYLSSFLMYFISYY